MTDRVPFGGLTEVEIEELVARVSKKIMEDFYQEVGRSVINRVLQVIGIAAVVLGVWLIGTGRWKVLQ